MRVVRHASIVLDDTRVENTEFQLGDQRTGRRDDVDLYARTYSTVLRTSGEVHLRAFQRAHENVSPSLHPGASRPEVDTGALIYAANRLPAVIGSVQQVILGQLPEDFRTALGARLDEWIPVRAPARRRQWHFHQGPDGKNTLAVHVASASDIDDVVSTLVAYQIEWNKVHALLQADPGVRAVLERTRRLVPLTERIGSCILADAPAYGY